MGLGHSLTRSSSRLAGDQQDSPLWAGSHSLWCLVAGRGRTGSRSAQLHLELWVRRSRARWDGEGCTRMHLENR